MSEFFRRNAYVTVLPSNSKKGLKIGGDPYNPVKIKFDVEKFSESGEGGTCKIDLYNLSATTIAAIRGNDTNIRLNAGYGFDTPVLAYGSVYCAPMRLQGSDQVLSIEVIESGLQLDTTRISFNLGPDCTNSQAINIVLQQLKEAGVVLGQITLLDPVITYRKGFHYSGMAKTILSRLCHAVNYCWSISNGNVNIMPRTQKLKPSTYVLSPETGLIDIPTPNIQNLENNDFVMFEFKSLLNPRIQPHTMIELKSKYVKQGFFQVFSAKHTGDTLEGNEYATSIQAFRVVT